jgi:hypothetical protein
MERPDGRRGLPAEKAPGRLRPDNAPRSLSAQSPQKLAQHLLASGRQQLPDVIVGEIV